MDSVRIECGGVSDYAGLAHWHYRAAAPAVPALTLRAVCKDAVVGALVVAMPVLNAPWRIAAWPGWLDGLDKRDHAAELNLHLRTIARLVVAPPFRARGVGSALVRAYLRDPLTEKTEALAAMGPLCPVFERAGMRRVKRPPGRAEARVVRVLRERSVRPWMLADLRVRARLARDPSVAQAVRSLAIDRWRAGKDRPAEELLERLWPGIAARPRAYAFDSIRAESVGRQAPTQTSQTH